MFLRVASRVVAALAMSILLARPLRADQQAAETRFNAAYETLVRADEARDANRTTRALELYRKAQAEHEALATEFPDWQSGIVGFRRTYCENQVQALQRDQAGEPRAAEPPVTAPAPAVPAPIPPAVDVPAPVLATNAPVAAVPVPPAPPPPAAPVDVAVLTHKAVLLLRQAEPAQAHIVLMEALRLAPDNARVRLLLGMAQCQAQNFEDAATILGSLVEDDPSNAAARATLATAWFGTGRADEAVNEMMRALTLNPGMKEGHYDLAQMLAARQPPDLESAREHYRKSLDLGGRPDPRLEQALAAPPAVAPPRPPPLPDASVHEQAQQPNAHPEGQFQGTNGPAAPVAP